MLSSLYLTYCKYIQMLLNEWMDEEPTQGGSKRRKNGRLGRAVSYVAPCSQRCCVKAPMFCFFSREGAGRGPSPEDEPLKDQLNVVPCTATLSTLPGWALLMVLTVLGQPIPLSFLCRLWGKALASGPHIHPCLHRSHPLLLASCSQS